MFVRGVISILTEPDLTSASFLNKSFPRYFYVDKYDVRNNLPEIEKIFHVVHLPIFNISAKNRTLGGCSPYS